MPRTRSSQKARKDPQRHLRDRNIHKTLNLDTGVEDSNSGDGFIVDDNYESSSSSDDEGSLDGFVVGDNVIIPDSDEERKSQKLEAMDRKTDRKNRRPSSDEPSTSKQKKRRPMISSDDEDVKEEDDDSVEEPGRHKCCNPNCTRRVATVNDLKSFCNRCKWWEHPFHLSIHDCKKNGNFNCFYCDQLLKCRGSKSMKYGNVETLVPIVLRKGDRPIDFPDPDQTMWKFHWNKFIKEGNKKYNVKLGDCIRIKERKGKFKHLVRVNYIIVDGNDHTWVAAYQFIDATSPEITKLKKEDFEVDNRNFKKLFPTQKFLISEPSYYSLRTFEICDVVACVWYKEYYGTVRGFPEEKIFPFVFNYYDEEEVSIEFVDVPDWRVCKYEFLGVKGDTKDVAVSTDEVTPTSSGVPEETPEEPHQIEVDAQEPVEESVQVPATFSGSPAVRVKQEPMEEGESGPRQVPQLSRASVPVESVEEIQKRETREKLARDLLKGCMISRTPLVIHPDIELTEPSNEFKITWKFPL